MQYVSILMQQVICCIYCVKAPPNQNMKLADFPVSVFTLAPAMPENALSTHVANFTTHLKNASIIPKDTTGTTLKAYVMNVNYRDYVSTFNNYWKSQPEATKIVESFLVGCRNTRGKPLVRSKTA